MFTGKVTVALMMMMRRVKVHLPNSPTLLHLNAPAHTPHAPPDVSLREGPSLNIGYEKDKRLLETQEQMAEQPDAFGGIQKQTEGALAKQESPSKTRCSRSQP